MPRQIIDPTEAQSKRQQRNQRYRANIARREQEKKQDRLYQQVKREQARLRQHQVLLMQLADIATQQQYLEAENDRMDEMFIIGAVREEEEEIVDVSGMMMKDDEVLENSGQGDEGFPDEGFPDDVHSDMNDNDDDQLNGGFEQEDGSTLEGSFGDNDWNADEEESGIIIY